MIERVYNDKSLSVMDAIRELQVGDITHLSLSAYNKATVRNVVCVANGGAGKGYIDKVYMTSTHVKNGYVTIRKRGR